MKYLNSYYLAGLFEGDGNIYVSKDLRNKDGKIIYPYIGLAFHRGKDLPFIHVLQKHLGGNLHLRKDNLAGSLSFGSKKDLVQMVDILNGRMRGPQVLRLHECIDWLNAHYSLNIIKKPADSSCLSSNAWLSGFIDAEGCFQIRNSTRINASFEVAQGPYYLNEHCNRELMETIARFCDSKLYVNSCNKAYVVCTVNPNARTKLIEYFEKYPLFTSKHLDYKDWVCAVEIIKSGSHYERRDEITILKNGMNSKRTYFNWDHLRKVKGA